MWIVSFPSWKISKKYFPHCGNITVFQTVNQNMILIIQNNFICCFLKCCACYYNQVTNRSAKVSNIGLPQTGNVLHFLNLFP